MDVFRVAGGGAMNWGMSLAQLSFGRMVGIAPHHATLQEFPEAILLLLHYPYSCTMNVIFMLPCPVPQKWSQMAVNVPAVCGVMLTSTVCPAGMSWSSLSARTKIPCVTSSLFNTSFTVSPFFNVTSAGTKAKRFAVMLMVRGPESAWVVGAVCACTGKGRAVVLAKPTATAMTNIDVAILPVILQLSCFQDLLNAFGAAEFT